jgi:exosortase A
MSDSGVKDAVDTSPKATGGWYAALPALLVAVVVLWLFWPTALSMVEIWVRSDTFTHGFLIVPITLWLVWERRAHLRHLVPAFSWQAVVAFVLAGLGWLAGHVADVMVVAQFGLVGMVIAAVWASLGNDVTRQLIFPLGFLFFAVPVGEPLVQPMMEFTATFTVELLRLTGIPVYREGLYFSLPSGNWSIVYECSGVRYIIASVTLGVLYAYLAYRSYWRRVAFIVASAIVPVIANGLRAYIIVMLGHLSDMKIATGVDHLIYGWVFFGLIMFILFSVGAIWRQPEEPLPEAPSGAVPKARPVGVLAGASAVVALGIGLRLMAAQIAAHESVLQLPLVLPSRVGEWQQVTERPWSWAPSFLPADQTAAATYRRGKVTITVDVAHFVRQRQGAEAISSENHVVGGKESPWRVVDTGLARLDLPLKPLSVVRYSLTGPRPLAVWRWYRVGDVYTANDYVGKLLQSLDRLRLDRSDAAVILVAAGVDTHGQPPTETVNGFVADLLPALDKAIDKSVGLP